MLIDKVARLRQLMSESVPRKAVETSEAETTRRFQLYEFNAGPALVIEQTPRARSERDIERVARWYGWDCEIVRALDLAGVSSLQGLDDASLHELHARMKRLEECIREGLDSPDIPPAR